MSTPPAVDGLEPDWPTCREDLVPPCAGVQAIGFDRCLAHLAHDDLGAVLGRLRPGADLDARGTTFDTNLLTKLLYAVSGEDGDGPRFGTLLCTHAWFTGDAGFDGARFDGHAWFDGVRFDKDAEFGDARFGGRAWFGSARFAGRAWFGDARFDGYAEFGDARFDGRARFDRAQFGGDARFDGAVFSGNASFVSAQFDEVADFDGARFSRDSLFDGARFGGDTQLNGARFSRDAGFGRAQFTAATKLGPFTAAALELDEVVFARPVVVEVEAGRVSCDRARFESGATLQVKYATVSLKQVALGGPSSLEGRSQLFLPVTFATVQASLERAEAWDRRAAQYRDRGELRLGEEWVPGLISLQGTDVSELVLTDVDLRWCRFAGAHHLDKLRIECRCPFHRPPRGWHRARTWPPVRRWTRRQVLAEEHAWRRGELGGIDAGWQSYPFDQDPAGVGPERLAVLYRSLRKTLEDGKDEAGAGDFYYGEMEARRHSGSLRDRIVLTAYWLLSGYGQRAGRALAGLAVLVAVITVLLLGCGLPANSVAQPVTGTLQVAGPPTLPPPAQRWTWNRTEKALQIALGSVAFRDAGQQLTPAGTWIVMTGRFLGPVLLALAALAVRARVKR
ncbi:pentapeptide repeat-containing protein [Amycolatopsis nigrescens]|uniref:pentapeptide repeat-containing protein n=1 Tax=Amycolatopsis nigrescens TaxID=381445 RepID=UPI00248182BB|nr:pentapeptide repeat-containing protein [Amycolatopsis nigrescens]